MTAEQYESEVRALGRYGGSFHSLSALGKSGPTIGKVYWIENKEKAVIVRSGHGEDKYHISDFTPIEITDGMTILEMNKALVAKERVFDWAEEEQLHEMNTIVLDFLKTETDTFFLLYDRENNYLSLFQKTSQHDHNIHALYDAIADIGELISIHMEDDAGGVTFLEVWVRTESKDCLLRLLPFDSAIIPL